MTPASQTTNSCPPATLVDQTKPDFTDRFVRMLKGQLKGKPAPEALQRLEEINQNPKPGLAAFDDIEFQANAVAALSQLPGSPPLGSCTYKVGGTTFCIHNVGSDACEGLQGCFDPANRCDPTALPWPS